MYKITNKKLLDKAALCIALPEEIITNLDLFLANTDLTKKQQEEFMNIIEAVYGVGKIDGYNMEKIE